MNKAFNHPGVGALKLCFVLLLSLLCTNAHAYVFSPTGSQACFYDQPGYLGNETCFAVGEVAALEPAKANLFQSVRVPPSVEVFGFDNINYTGSMEVYSQDVVSLIVLPGRINSLKVYDVTTRQYNPLGVNACFYTQPDYQGTEFCYGVGEYAQLERTQINLFQSVRVPPSVEVFGFDYSFFTGQLEVYAQDIGLLINLSKDIGALKVYDVTTRQYNPLGKSTCFYTQPDYQGAEFCYGVGEYAQLERTLINLFQSVRVPPSVEVFGFDYSFFTGQMEIYSRDSGLLINLLQDIGALKVYDVSVRQYNPQGMNACFYTQPDYQGAEFCYGVGEYAQLERTLIDLFQSIRVPSGLQVSGYDYSNFTGYMEVYAQDMAVLGLLTQKLSSVKVTLLDSDGDGVADVYDAFPNDPTESADLDGDGSGDNSDPDIDGDGISNVYEIQLGTDPANAASVPPDLDGDGIPDTLDTDMDGDGVANNVDLFPSDSTEFSDLDADGIGDNSDPDRDGDGFSNDQEVAGGSNPDDSNDVPGASLRVSFSLTNPVVSDSQFVDLTGTAQGDIIDRVYLTSDHFAGTTFSAIYANGSWSARVALKVGDNTIRAHVDGNNSEHAQVDTIIQRSEPAPLISMVLSTPANNSLVNVSNIIVVGRINSEIAIGLPVVNVNNRVADVSQGASPTEFIFQAAVALQQGSNNIIASAVVAGQVLQQTLIISYLPLDTQVLPPAVGILSPQPGSTFNTDSFVLNAQVFSDAGLSAVTVNGESLAITPTGQFVKTLNFAGQPTLDVVIVATDNSNQSSTLTASYRLDTQAPLIQLDVLQPYPVENTISENPYRLTGTVTDANLLQLTLNDQVLTLRPAEAPNSYRFSTSLALPAGLQSSIHLRAVDSAGQTTTAEYLLLASSLIQIEWLAPVADSQILLQGSAQSLALSARLSDVTGIGSVQAQITGQAVAPVTLTLDSALASGQLVLPDVAGEYTLQLNVLDINNQVLASSSRSFSLLQAQTLALGIVKITPQDEASDVEPNDFIAVFFNKPVDLSLLSIQLNETAHGFSYIDVDQAGLDGIHARGFELQDVNRDYVAVPGVFSLLPNNTTAVFYPQRDLAYNADVYATVIYNGEELARRHFRVRPRPTFIEGLVIDNLTQAVAGVEVTIPALNRSTTTDKDGSYSFGYGDSADQTLAQGSYQIHVNSGLRDNRFGSYQGYINIQSGSQNQVKNIMLALLNNDVAFSYLNSGLAATINGNEINLDATRARYIFNDGRSEGSVHLQFLPYSSLKINSFKLDYTPMWAYAAQPAGVRVEGDLQLEFALPQFQGSFDYAPLEGEMVLLLGSSEDGTHLLPAGVGEALAGHRIRSLGETHFKRLDYLAYARITPELYADLNRYIDGTLTLQQLTLNLQTYSFVPPVNEAEALQRGNALLDQR